MAQTRPDATIVINIKNRKWRIRIYVGIWRKLKIVCRHPNGEVKENNGNGTVTKTVAAIAKILKEIF